MAIANTVDIRTTGLWPQGDIRDPLGVWGFRVSITGDASGGSKKITAQAPAALAAAYLYTLYSAIIVQTAPMTSNPGQGKIRILTNWPNVDLQAGVNAYAEALFPLIDGSSNFTAPLDGPTTHMVGPNSRFLLMFDPRQSAGILNLVELEFAENVLNEIHSYEGYGYFWDRSVLNAPGGPRHPGAS